jgi:hypothetical protein
MQTCLQNYLAVLIEKSVTRRFVLSSKKSRESNTLGIMARLDEKTLTKANFIQQSIRLANRKHG